MIALRGVWNPSPVYIGTARRQPRLFLGEADPRTETRPQNQAIWAQIVPRSHRIDIPNGLHHVTQRGLERRNIVRDDGDRSPWWRLFERVARRCRWRVFVVALFDNGFLSPTPDQSEIASRRVRLPRSRSVRRGRANEAETWIVDGAITATSTATPQTV